MDVSYLLVWYCPSPWIGSSSSSLASKHCSAFRHGPWTPFILSHTCSPDDLILSLALIDHLYANGCQIYFQLVCLSWPSSSYIYQLCTLTTPCGCLVSMPSLTSPMLNPSPLTPSSLPSRSVSTASQKPLWHPWLPFFSYLIYDSPIVALCLCLQNMSKVWPLNISTVATLVPATIISDLSQCNNVPTGLPVSTSCCYLDSK